MAKITRDDLYSLEDYSEMRDDFRAKIMAHKKNRRLELGENVVLHFEDQLIMHYQIQEMLRAEKIFEAKGIDDELNAYNPLIPDGSNFKATMMIQYSDIDERKTMLEKLIGIEDLTWLQVNDHDKVFAIADEDMERATETKTSAVHFLRFELNQEMVTALKEGATLDAGIDHESYTCSMHPVTANITESLIGDLD
jgi:hypothetical protein